MCKSHLKLAQILHRSYLVDWVDEYVSYPTPLLQSLLSLPLLRYLGYPSQMLTVSYFSPLFHFQLPNLIMKLSTIVLLAAFSGTNAFTSVNNGPRVVTELNARQPIMAGNWKVSLQQMISCEMKLLFLTTYLISKHILDESSYRIRCTKSITWILCTS